LDPTPPRNFAPIVALLKRCLRNVVVLEENATPQRAILRVSAQWGHYRVFVTEIVSAEREYRYYVLDNDLVVVGFDNAADPRAVELKFGKLAKQHYGERIPHLHRDDKAILELTEELRCADFIVWLEANLDQGETIESLSRRVLR